MCYQVCPEEAEYGRKVHCDAANYRPLRRDSAEAWGMSYHEMVVAGGTGPTGRKDDGGGGSGWGRGE